MSTLKLPKRYIECKESLNNLFIAGRKYEIWLVEDKFIWIIDEYGSIYVFNHSDAKFHFHYKYTL